MGKKKSKDKRSLIFEDSMKWLFFACSGVAVLSVALITIFIFSSGGPAIFKIGFFKFLFGIIWSPKDSIPQFGILSAILGSIITVVGALLIGVPIGILTGVFLARIAPPWIVNLVRPAVQLLAGIPSVIYGLFGLTVVVPLLARIFHLPFGQSLLAAIVILSIMVLPIIISITETSIRAVPEMYYEASLAVGATHMQTIFKVLIPSAKSGILAGVILGMGRAIGETMAIIMVIGNSTDMLKLWPPLVPFFSTGRTLTTSVVNEMGYAEGLHKQALFGIALVLFFFIIILNTIMTIVARKAGAKNVS